MSDLDINKSATCIATINIDDYCLFIHQGRLSKNDIKIKYRNSLSRPRTPSHIHWVVDILMKSQVNPDLTRDFITLAREDWQKIAPLYCNDIDSIRALILNSNLYTQCHRFSDLNNIGEYSMEFLSTLIILLIAQEKTNNPNAYLFGKILDKLESDKLDIFSILSTAIFRGR